MHRTRIPAFAASLLFLLALLAGPEAAHAGDWKFLGERSVTDRLDHDVIVVTAAKGEFRRIKLKVKGHAVDFHRVVVHYANGGDDTIEIRQRVREGGETRSIDLRGHDRFLRSVEFWYDAESRHGHKGVVRLYGKR